MGEPDTTMNLIGEGIALSQRGERDAARKLFAQVWSEIGGENGDPLHRCALAHSMADVQDDVHEELLWDLRALAAADFITDERAAEVGVQSPVAGFYPSLHTSTLVSAIESWATLIEPESTSNGAGQLSARLATTVTAG